MKEQNGNKIVTENADYGAQEARKAQDICKDISAADAQEAQKNGKAPVSMELGEATGHYIVKTDIDTNGITPPEDIPAEKMAEMWQQLQTAVQNFGTALEEYQLADKRTIQTFTEHFRSIAPEKMLEDIPFSELNDFFDFIQESSEQLTGYVADYALLKEYSVEELKKPEYGGATLSDIIAEHGERYEMFMAAVREKGLLSLTVTGKGAANIEYPVDKVNNKVWTLLRDADKNGQLAFNIGTEKRGSEQEANIYYSISFSDLENTGLSTVKRLTAFDKRVYLATNALYNSSGDVMTVSQIYASMGYDGRPNGRDIEKIYTSLEKMRLLPIMLDNTNEHNLYKNMKPFFYNGVLLPWESIDAIVNGQRANGIIHLFREPPLVSFAKDRKQITTVSQRLLASPVSKTDINLRVDDYLIEQIAYIKHSNGKVSNKLLYTTIFEKTHITTKKQRFDAKDKIQRYLEHYQKCGFIKSFKEEADGVTIKY